MSRLRSGFCWSRRLSMALFLCVLVCGLFAETPNEPPDWNSELESLRQLLLSQIAYAEKLIEFSEKQKARLADYEALLEEQRQILMDSDERIASLSSQLTVSNRSTETLQKELENLGVLHARLRTEHEELLRSWNGYKQESQKQIDQLRAERDRWARWRTAFWIGTPAAALLGLLVGALIF